MNRNKIFLAMSLIVANTSVSAEAYFPTANPDDYTTTVNSSISFMPMNNDVGDAMYITKVDSPAPWGTGSNTFTGSEITYTPPKDFTGDTTFWYQVKDKNGNLTSAPITIKVNQAKATTAWPLAEEDSASTSFGQAITIDPLVNDTGDGLTLVDVNATTTAGSAAKIVDNKILYTPSIYAPAGDSFWYVMQDKFGRKNAAKITVTVSEGEEKGAYPTAGSDAYTVTKGSSGNTFTILSNDTGNGLSIKQLYDWTAMAGRTSQTDGVVSYTAPDNFTGTDNFWYVIEDSYGRTNAAKVTIEVVESTGTGTGTSTETTAGVACDYDYSAYNSSASVLTTSTSNWSCTDTDRVLTANGIPDHEVGIFPNSGNPNEITEQEVSATITLTPNKTDSATEMGGPRGVTGYVLNGVKIDAGTAGSCDSTGTSCSLVDNSGSWSIEALGQTSFDFGDDENNAHVQPGGTYHYHGMPEGFLEKQGSNSSTMTLIGWAADGFPIYGRYGYSVADDASSAIKVITGSYQKVDTTDGSRPSTADIPLGTFAQDWQYVAGSGDLDECNGRTGVTPEFPNGTYHYFATDSYPYFQRCVKGEVEGAAQGGGQMGPPPGA